VSAQHTELKILILAPASRRGEFSHQLRALSANVLFVARSVEAATVVREGDLFQVALLPASLSDTDWWELWGVLALMNPRPALLVYAREASFQLWSGVLELGGYDVIVEPFSDEELQDAVLRAAKSFEERPPNGTDS
jgi:CheY-like chemotaxis protein